MKNVFVWHFCAQSRQMGLFELGSGVRKISFCAWYVSIYRLKTKQVLDFTVVAPLDLLAIKKGEFNNWIYKMHMMRFIAIYL